MNILYIAHRIPYPPNKGDKIRSFHQIRHLAARHRLFVCALVDVPGDFQYRKPLSRYCEQLHLEPLRHVRKKIFSLRGLVTGISMSALYFYEQRLQEHIDRILDQHRIDAIFCFSGTSSAYVFRSPHLASAVGRIQGAEKKDLSHTARPRLIMDFCDIDSVKWQEYATRSCFPLSWMYRREAKLLAGHEQQTCNSFDHLVVVSESEKTLLTPFFPAANRAIVISNGVDLKYFYAADPSPDHRQPILLFTGAMDYHANVDGVLWFVKQVWPLLRKRFPDIRFIVAGRNPAPPVKRLDREKNITVTGEVEDIRDWYIKADCCVVPLRIARGIQNKLLEAMAMARPVVTTSAALQGIRAEPDHDLLVADDPQVFFRAVERLLNSRELRIQTGRNGRQAMEKYYNWSTNLSRLEQLLGQ